MIDQKMALELEVTSKCYAIGKPLGKNELWRKICEVRALFTLIALEAKVGELSR